MDDVRILLLVAIYNKKSIRKSIRKLQSLLLCLCLQIASFEFTLFLSHNVSLITYKGMAMNNESGLLCMYTSTCNSK